MGLFALKPPFFMPLLFVPRELIYYLIFKKKDFKSPKAAFVSLQSAVSRIKSPPFFPWTNYFKESFQNYLSPKCYKQHL